MGAVYRAWDERLQRWVAIKQIRPESAASERVRERFRREARASARLNHPSIVQIFDILESEDGDWIVMELVEGRTLARLLQEEHPDLRRVLGLAREIAWALAEAHRKNIVHRDLKAENVLVTADGHAKILDFGLAKVVEAQGEATLTIPGGPMGTARSMSPEQARGLELDARSDLFSFGVLLYEAIAGVSPFQGQTVFDTLVRVATHEPPPLSETLPELPGELVGLVGALLQKDPAQRPQDVGEVLEVLDRLLGDEEAGTSALRLLNLPRRSPASSTELLAPTLTESSAGSGSAPAASSGSGSAKASGSRSSGARPVAGRPAGVAVAVAGHPVSPSQASTLEGPPPPRPARRFALALLIAALLAAVPAFFWAWRPGPAPGSLYVAVRQPEVSGGGGIASAELLATGLRVALLNTLASLEGISPLAPETVDPVEGSSLEVARASGADEVVTAHLACQSESCLVSLTRLRGSDGSVIWSGTFQCPPEDLHTIATAGSVELRNAYADFRARDGGPPQLDLPNEVFREFSAVLRDYRGRQGGADDWLARLAKIEDSAPRFVEPALLAAEILRLRFVESSRNPADLERSIAAGRRAGAQAPGDVRPLHRIFDALLEAKNLPEAETVLREIDRLEPGQPEAQVRRALLLDRQGRGEEGLALMRAAASQHPSWKMFFRLANYEVNLGRVEEAKTHLERTLELLPGHYDSLSLLAQIELVAGSPQRAATLYAQLVEQSPGVTELSNLGVAEAMLGRWENARVSMAQAVALEPRNPFLLLNLADSEAVLGRGEEAQAHYRLVLELLPDGPQRSAQELSVRAQAAAHLGDFPSALAAIQRALQLASGSPQVYYEATVVYALAGEKGSALVNARQAAAGGIDRRWFSAPWFDAVRAELPLGPAAAP